MHTIRGASVKFVSGLIMLLIPALAFASITYTKVSNITQIWTWGQSASSYDGDVVLLVDTGMTVCPSGVFIQSASDPDKKLYASSLAAYMSGKSVMIQVYDDQIWGGSSTPYCKVRAIFLE